MQKWDCMQVVLPQMMSRRWPRCALPPRSFEWVTCNIDNDGELKEIYELLSAHYVEDDDNMFRFAYSREFLHWALQVGRAPYV